VARADRIDLLLGHGELLLQAAVDVDPDQLERVARIGATDAARITLPAGLQRPQSYALADLELTPAPWPDGHHAAADLMALDPRELRPAGRLGQLAGEEVVVRAADADRLGRDHYLVRPG